MIDILILSGDRHMAEISQYDFPDGSGLTRSFEFTSSGMSHSWSTFRDEANQYRVSEQNVIENFGVLRIYRNDGLVEVDMEVRDDAGIPGRSLQSSNGTDPLRIQTISRIPLSGPFFGMHLLR